MLFSGQTHDVYQGHPACTPRSHPFPRTEALPYHPLDQLSAAEIQTAAALVAKYATTVSKGTPRYNTITLAVSC